MDMFSLCSRYFGLHCIYSFGCLYMESFFCRIAIGVSTATLKNNTTSLSRGSSPIILPFF